MCMRVHVHVYSRITGEKEFISSQIRPDVAALCHGAISEDAALWTQNPALWSQACLCNMLQGIAGML